jgi:hypothetical protein
MVSVGGGSVEWWMEKGRIEGRVEERGGGFIGDMQPERHATKRYATHAIDATKGYSRRR